MSKIFRAATPLTSRIAPVLGAVLVLIGLMASSQLHLAQVTAGSTVTTDKSDYVRAGIAPNGDPGGFEIQGGVVATAGGGHTDWIANGVGTTGLLTSAGVPIDPTVTYRRLDAYNLGDDVFSGSHTFNDNPNTY